MAQPNDLAESARPKLELGHDIILKFSDNVTVRGPGELSADDWIAENGFEALPSLRSEGPISIAPLFDMAKLGGIVALAQERDQSYQPPRFENYFILSHSSAHTSAEVVEQISNWKGLEAAYPALELGPPPALPPRQAYLISAPMGVSFFSSAGPRLNVPGVNGDGICFGDLEEGWDFDHPLMPKRPGGGVDGGVDVAKFPEHGRKAVGIVSALPQVTTPPSPVDPNTYLSLAPNATTRFYSAWVRLTPGGAPRYNVAKAITEAIAGTYKLHPGDVLLLELQAKFPNTNYYGPVEVAQDVYDIIRLATAYGVIVVEPAGTNPSGSAQNIDNYLTRPNSGAYIVGACDAMNNWLDVSNFGSRVDFFARGCEMSVLGPHDSGPPYYADVGTETGTSWSAAIIAGVVTSTQGMVRAASGGALAYRLSPAVMRRLLATSSPTLSNDSAAHPIGVMPNLEAISAKFATVPDIYLRDELGDTGCPGISTGTESPDITIRRFNDMVIDPNDSVNNYSQTISPSDTPYLYARVTNRAPAGSVGSDLTGICVTFYQATTTTLATPSAWQQVGSPAFLMWLGAGMSSILTVNSQTQFPSSRIIIAIVTSNEDPAPSLVGLTSVDATTLFRNCNNMTRRTLVV